MTTLDAHIAAIEREAALFQALLAQLRAERAYQAAGNDPARRARTAAERDVARYRAAQEEEDSDF
jgi:hypothetical protein